MDIKRVIQELVVPELQEIKSDIKVLSARMDAIDSRISSLEREISNAREDIRSLRGEFRLAIDIHERLAAVESKLGK